jgi:hypothetical protein
VHGSNAKNLSVQLSLSQASQKCYIFLIFYVFSSTKLEEKRAEQVLLGSKEGWGERER